LKTTDQIRLVGHDRAQAFFIFNQFRQRLPLQPVPAVPAADETDFLKKALLNDDLWNKLLASR
jgi:hypothetical protein